jgi:two-component system, NarL family, response regulator DevR
MIRTLIVDRHPALRAGVKVVLEAERDMVVVGDTGALDELLPLLRRTRPDVVLLDCRPPMVADLRACRLVKCLLPAPRALIYSAYADERLRVAARVAGADGLLDKNSSALDLVQAIRAVHGGRRLLEPIEPGDVQDATRSLDRQEAQILALLLDDVPPSGIAVALSMPPATVGRRVNDIAVPDGQAATVASFSQIALSRSATSGTTT